MPETGPLVCIGICVLSGSVVGLVMPILHWTGNYEFGTTQACYCPEDQSDGERRSLRCTSRPCLKPEPRHRYEELQPHNILHSTSGRALNSAAVMNNSELTCDEESFGGTECALKRPLEYELENEMSALKDPGARKGA